MRAILVREFGGPEVMHLDDVPALEAGPGQVLVTIRAAGVNPVDAYVRTGTYPQKPALPYTPGFDGAGEVAAVGGDVVSVKSGDRVYIANDNLGTPRTGTYAQQALCAATQLHRLPPNASFAQGAALGVPYVTAYRALIVRAGARPGETVLVHGASGGVGIAAVQFARAQGMRVIGTAGSDRGMQLVREQGAEVVVSHKEPEYTSAIMKATDGRGADVILEMAAHLNLDKDLAMLARFGRVVVVGNRGRVEIDPRATMARDAAILGLTLFNATWADLGVVHAAIVAGLANGTLKPVVGRELPLADAASAHEAVMKSGALGKIVLIP
ncbi:MAG: zinc-binding dehydrogenase [Luteitalea sp.]|nr:zinc-binding dehydrogenase [Luteitalea sp.]